MAHRFDHSDKDPYSEAAKAVSQNVASRTLGVAAGAESQIYDQLGDAIVTALGDIAAEAYKLGVSQPEPVTGLGRAITTVTGTVLQAYDGDVDPEPVLHAMESDVRIADLPAETQQTIRQEIEKTRQLERLLLEARRLPALLDYLGSMGLRVEEDRLDQSPLLVGAHPTPNVERG